MNFCKKAYKKVADVYNGVGDTAKVVAFTGLSLLLASCAGSNEKSNINIMGTIYDESGKNVAPETLIVKYVGLEKMDFNEYRKFMHEQKACLPDASKDLTPGKNKAEDGP
jgi:hypothetical protein